LSEQFGGAEIFFADSHDMSGIADNSVQLIVTTPPSGYIRNEAGAGGTYEEYISILSGVFHECVRVLEPEGKLCINIKPYFEALHENGMTRRLTRTVLGDIEKAVLVSSCMYEISLFVIDCRSQPHLNSFGSYPYPTKIFSSFPYEWIAVFSKTGKRISPSHETKSESKLTKEEWSGWAVNSIWTLPPVSAKQEGHPEPTSPEMSRRLIKMYSFEGDTVLDPFLGTGTTAAQTIKLNRHAVGFEINTEYRPVIENKLNFAQIKQISLFDTTK